MTNINIKDKVVFITGGSSGIGEKTARTLAEQGAKVVIAARRKDKLETIVKDINSSGGQAMAIELDATKSEQVEKAVNEAVSHFGRLDIMINNAGYMAVGPLENKQIEDWDRMIDINIKGVLYGIAAALPIFKKQKSGHFINLSSVAGIKVFAPGGAVYSGTKYAVRAISEGLRQEVTADNIRVTTIEPGATDTDMFNGAGEGFTDRVKMTLPVEAISNAITYAIEQPANVGVNEITVRSTAEQF